MKQAPKGDLNVEEWLKKAKEDEWTCEVLFREKRIVPSIICFHAEQMAEKYLKALLIARSGEYPKIHDLKRLATLIETYEKDIFDLESELNILNKYYPATRYPGDFPEGFSREDAHEAFAAAKRVKEFILAKIKNAEK